LASRADRGVTGRLARRQAACGRYCSHAVGIVGVATWMKISARGVRGARCGCIPACRGVRSPLRRLQGAQEATMLSQLDAPPLERGITWSTVRFEREPQYWHVQLSRANTARRVILRRWASRGTLTYAIRRITTGRASVVLSECSSRIERSISSAFSFSSSTTARLTVQTLIGS